MTTIIDIAGLAGSTERAFTHAGERKAVRLRRTYAYSADELWSAWTEPERLARWLGELRGEASEGATVQLCMAPPDADIATITILACERPHRLTVKWEWPGEPDSVADLTIESAGEGQSVLSLEHVALVDPGARGYGGGWEDFLIKLDVFMRGGAALDIEWSVVEPVVQPRWNELAESNAIDDRLPVITSTDLGRDLRIVRSLAAPSDRVWTAITDPTVVARWFGAVDGDLTVGGSYSIVFDAGSASGVIHECVAPRRLVMSWRWSHEDTESVVEVRLEPDGDSDRTTVTIEQRNVTGPVVGYAAGWYAHLAALDRHLDGRARSESSWTADWELSRAMLPAR